jgi:two-component system nitrogen regulation sensor histidine kinase NtrY
MILKHIRFKLILRIVILSFTLFIVIYLFTVTDLYATAIIVALVGLYQIYSLIRFLDITNQRVIQFLEAIRYADFTQSFRGPDLGKSYRELNAAFAEVIKEFQRIRGDKEEHFRYLQTVVQHVGTGLLAFSQDGNIELINAATKRLFRISQIKNINKLTAINPDLATTLNEIPPRSRQMIKIQRGDELLQLVMYATEFRLRGRLLKLVSIQNIQSELEEQEMEAWQKLIRVLTHEIMNSITPISSLAKTTDELVSDLITTENPAPAKNDLKDIHQAVNTILKRSEGLIKFVESYRQLTRIPKPNLALTALTDIFQRVFQLFDIELNDRKIEYRPSVKPNDLAIFADVELIEQVLINLIKNSIDALANTDNAQISLTGYRNSDGRVVVEVSDNGHGIVAEAKEKIFIPFYTTKKTGSGIGLSLSRQIMRQHGGGLTVQSEPGVQTTFKLIFP